mgnify:FL=1
MQMILIKPIQEVGIVVQENNRRALNSSTKPMDTGNQICTQCPWVVIAINWPKLPHSAGFSYPCR